MSSPNRRPTGIKRIKFLELDGESIIYSSDNPRGYYLNKTATLIWKCCDGQHSLDDIEMKIIEIYDVESHELRNDIKNILLQFNEAKLLKD